MRGGIAINLAVIAVALFLAVQFALGRTDGAFDGRDPAEWNRAIPQEAKDLRAELLLRGCTSSECELTLILPRDFWLRLDRACTVPDDVCFSGARLNFSATLGRALRPGGPIAIRLIRRDGAQRTLTYRAIALRGEQGKIAG